MRYRLPTTPNTQAIITTLPLLTSSALALFALASPSPSAAAPLPDVDDCEGFPCAASYNEIGGAGSYPLLMVDYVEDSDGQCNDDDACSPCENCSVKYSIWEGHSGSSMYFLEEPSGAGPYRVPESSGGAVNHVLSNQCNSGEEDAVEFDVYVIFGDPDYNTTDPQDPEDQRAMTVTLRCDECCE